MARSSPKNSLSLLALVLLGLLPGSIGHGVMCDPRQRGAYKSADKCGSELVEPTNPVIDYCPHCLNGGAVGSVYGNLPKGGWKVYDPVNNFGAFGNRAGLCGDPRGGTDHMIGGTFVPPSYNNVPIVRHWKTGSQVDFQVEIDTNHNGYMEFYLCDLDKCQSTDITGNCFRDGHCHRLMRAPHPECQKPSAATHFKCGPIDSAYPGRFYVPCRKTGNAGVHMVGGSSGTMRYKLPAGLSCKHCVLQWYWATANSCAPTGFLDYFDRYNKPFGTTCPSDGGGIGAFRAGMAECGNDSIPEEFWSCADVQISPEGVNGISVVSVEGSTEGRRTSRRDKNKEKGNPVGRVLENDSEIENGSAFENGKKTPSKQLVSEPGKIDASGPGLKGSSKNKDAYKVGGTEPKGPEPGNPDCDKKGLECGK